jgi:hypothetical protein
MTLTGAGGFSASTEFAVSASPAPPVIEAVFPLVSAPTAADPCGSLAQLTPVTSVARGQGIALGGPGLDTTPGGARLRFSQGGVVFESRTNCALSSLTLLAAAKGVVQSATVPAGLVPGAATIEMSVTVRGADSAFSAPIAITIS